MEGENENKNKKRRMRDRYIGDFRDDYLEATRVICKCGHRVNFITNVPYIECTYCHNIIFRNKKTEYDFRVKRRLGIFK